ncbi:hypothetical protein GON03_05925 [Nocardioides sp. MAH-18]|uniref:TOMM leader peptide-binding protein n=1 Tax=Nocardioides agri TaxID=2682843 RepID=A0A6L6XPE1_9ACTN|nr:MULTISPECIES: hypothetical protein [unclassified Nocardioides]MBA2953848.1 hypothetical protein [Nocardioides sp. CGMCC 1.13656]MVQ48712.1 hypothetical protein [Nocardioides sp. MAH-18]
MSLLRPGLHVLRRDDRHLQVGLDPPWRLVVPDEPDVRRLLADLQAGDAPCPATPVGHRVLRELDDAGMLRRAAPPRGRVHVTGPDVVAAEARRLLTAAGAGVTADPGAADVALVLAAGEPARDPIDDHLRAGRPHLVVTAGAGGYRVGPFVVPGTTACLRCVDAHLGEHDPRRAVVVEQLAGRVGGPEDPALATVATAWAARDVLRYLSGELPTSWSATLDLGPACGAVRRDWARHPYCGCSWAQWAGPG